MRLNLDQINRIVPMKIMELFPRYHSLIASMTKRFLCARFHPPQWKLQPLCRISAMSTQLITHNEHPMKPIVEGMVGLEGTTL